MATSSLAILYGVWVIALWAMNANLARGWSSIIVLVAFLGGANMLMTGVMGVYVGRIYAEVKRRPLYIVDRTVGFEAAAKPATPRRKRQAASANAGESPSPARGAATLRMNGRTAPAMSLFSPAALLHATPAGLG